MLEAGTPLVARSPPANQVKQNACSTRTTDLRLNLEISPVLVLRLTRQKTMKQALEECVRAGPWSRTKMCDLSGEQDAVIANSSVLLCFVSQARQVPNAVTVLEHMLINPTKSALSIDTAAKP